MLDLKQVEDNESVYELIDNLHLYTHETLLFIEKMVREELYQRDVKGRIKN